MDHNLTLPILIIVIAAVLISIKRTVIKPKATNQINSHHNKVVRVVCLALAGALFLTTAIQTYRENSKSIIGLADEPGTVLIPEGEIPSTLGSDAKLDNKRIIYNVILVNKLTMQPVRSATYDITYPDSREERFHYLLDDGFIIDYQFNFNNCQATKEKIRINRELELKVDNSRSSSSGSEFLEISSLNIIKTAREDYQPSSVERENMALISVSTKNNLRENYLLLGQLSVIDQDTPMKKVTTSDYLKENYTIIENGLKYKKTFTHNGGHYSGQSNDIPRPLILVQYFKFSFLWIILIVLLVTQLFKNRIWAFPIALTIGIIYLFTIEYFVQQSHLNAVEDQDSLRAKIEHLYQASLIKSHRKDFINTCETIIADKKQHRQLKMLAEQLLIEDHTTPQMFQHDFDLQRYLRENSKSMLNKWAKKCDSTVKIDEYPAIIFLSLNNRFQFYDDYKNILNLPKFEKGFNTITFAGWASEMFYHQSRQSGNESAMSVRAKFPKGVGLETLTKVADGKYQLDFILNQELLDKLKITHASYRLNLTESELISLCGITLIDGKSYPSSKITAPDKSYNNENTMVTELLKHATKREN